MAFSAGQKQEDLVEEQLAAVLLPLTSQPLLGSDLGAGASSPRMVCHRRQVNLNGFLVALQRFSVLLVEDHVENPVQSLEWGNVQDNGHNHGH